MSQSQTLMTETVTELVALGAAMASNCESCFRAHYDRARKLGVSVEDMRRAVDTGLTVKAAPHRRMVEIAERYLAWEAPQVSGSCCVGQDQKCC